MAEKKESKGTIEKAQEKLKPRKEKAKQQIKQGVAKKANDFMHKKKRKR